MIVDEILMNFPNFLKNHSSTRSVFFPKDRQKKGKIHNEQIEYEMAYQKNREKEKFNLSESIQTKGTPRAALRKKRRCTKEKSLTICLR